MPRQISPHNAGLLMETLKAKGFFYLESSKISCFTLFDSVENYVMGLRPLYTFHYYSAGIGFICQNLTSTDARF